MEPKVVLPPGVEEYLEDVEFKVEHCEGRGEWMDYPAVKKFTNAFIIDEQNGRVSCSSNLKDPTTISRLITEIDPPRLQEEEFCKGDVSSQTVRETIRPE